MILTITMFCVGIIILLFSTQKLVKIAEKLSHILRISPLIIGITIVAIGTSLPELAVSLVSASKNDLGLAMGNIIGSNITNILMVLPIGILLGKMRIGKTKTQRNIVFLLGITALFILFQFISVPKIIVGIILICLSLIITYVEYHYGVLGRKKEDSKQFKVETKEKFKFIDMVFGLILILGIICGSILVVNSVEAISTLSGLSTTILGLTLTAVATSLPELLTTIFSQQDNQEKITVGNILGSNIYNLLLIGGIIMFFPTNTAIAVKEWMWLTISTIVFLVILKTYKGKTPSMWIGVVLIILFITYIITQ